jgi:chromosome segregation ATPase
MDIEGKEKDLVSSTKECENIERNIVKLTADIEEMSKNLETLHNDIALTENDIQNLGEEQVILVSRSEQDIVNTTQAILELDRVSAGSVYT